MTLLKRMARSAGVTAAAGCIGVAVMTTPAHAASGDCEKNYTCVWSKEHFTGRYGKVNTQLGACNNSRSVPIRSINNNSRHMLNLYSKTGCKGKVFSLNWGVKMADGFPFGAMSFKGVN
ncbi:peptidase inhibitor family I36 protein [Streptomyces sp. NPDC001135]